MAKISQEEILKEFFIKNPNKDIEHRDSVRWCMREYRKRSGKVFADPDRGIRKLHQNGFLIKVKKGVYRYDPAFVVNKKLEDFTPKIKEEIFKRDGYKCLVCGKGKKEGVEIQADHVLPKDKGGKATLQNGQTLCSSHNFLKKNFKQTEFAKRLFIRMNRVANKQKNTQIKNFAEDILKVFDKHKIDEHIG